MENGPNDSDITSELLDKKDSKKKKKAEKLGSFLVAPEDKKKSKENPDKKAEETDKSPEDRPIEELSSDEKQFIEKEYAQAHRTEKDVYDASEPEDILVDEFYERIEQGLESEAALEEVVDSMHPEDEPVGEEQDKEDSEGGDIRTMVASAISRVLPEGRMSVPLENEFSVIEHSSADNVYRPVTEVQESNVASKKTSAIPRSSSGSAFMGGTTGYLMGRRTSRIKSESNYIPVQKKLEQKIIEIGNALADKEAVIRKLARQNVVTANRAQNERTMHGSAEHKPTPKAPEHLGQFIIESDKVIFDRQSKPQEENVAKKSETKSEKHIDTFSRTELLAISQKIIVDGTSLRQIYETHLVGERGLRRLVKEHLRGGNVKKALKREIVERQIDFERDPIVRDKAYTEVARQESSDTKLETIIQKVDSSLPYVNSGTLSFEPKMKEVQPKESRNNTLDMAFVGIIFMLTATIIFLLLKGY